MSMFTRPTVRVESADGDSSPVEAKLESDGRIRIASDPDSGRLNGAWLTPAEVREFAIDLLGLADASEVIHAEHAEPASIDETYRAMTPHSVVVDVVNGAVRVW